MESKKKNKTSENHEDASITAYLEKVDHPALSTFLQQTVSYKDGYYRVQPYGMIFPKCYLKFDQRIRDFKIEDSDVWVATSIKSGNHHDFSL